MRLTLEDIAESTSKAKAAKQKSLDFLAKVVFDSWIVLDCLLARKEVFVLWPTPFAIL